MKSILNKTFRTSIESKPLNNIVCANEGISIIEFYKEYFDTVFIILHPFFKAKNSVKTDFNNDYPNKCEISQDYDLITWENFLEKSNIESYKSLDIALRTSIGGLNKNYADDFLLKKLNETLENFKIHEPNEGFFEDSLIDSIMNSFVSLGHDELYIGNEWGNEKKLVAVNDILTNKIEIGTTAKNLYSKTNNLLYTVHWDSHFTMLCSSLDNVKKIVSKYNFEGFYCDSKTDIYWSINKEKK